MDTVSRHSAVYITDTHNMAEYMSSFQFSLPNQFWAPENVHDDLALHNEQFNAFCASIGAKYDTVSHCLHHNNHLESKYPWIRLIYLRLKADGAYAPDNLLAYRAVGVRNALYGRDTVSAFEQAKGYMKAIELFGAPNYLPDDIRFAHEKLVEKRTLNLILR